MIFTDLIFVFAFLPIYIIAEFSSREAWAKNMISIAASLLFIAWGRSLYYALIILPVFLIYICGLLRRRFGAVFEVLGDVIAAASAGFAVVSLAGDGTLHSALLSVGFILYALRAVNYLKKVSDGMAPERDLLCLAVYLISFENMLIAPLMGYDKMQKKLASRRPTLSKTSAGLSAFIKGFAKVAVFGLSFDAVRIAATEYEAFPWLNAITLIVVTFGEVYVITAGFLEMSAGLCMISGFSPEYETSAFLPKFRVSEHVAEMWRGLPAMARKNFAERSLAGTLISLAALSLMTGIFIGFGAKAGAFLVVLIILMTLEETSPKRNKAADLIFSAVLMTVAFLVLVGGSFNGISAVLGAIDPSAYDYDITYILNFELIRRLPWLIIGAVAVSPLYRLAENALRRKMAENERAYTALRVADTAVCAVLLVLGTIAAL